MQENLAIFTNIRPIFEAHFWPVIDRLGCLPLSRMRLEGLIQSDVINPDISVQLGQFCPDYKLSGLAILPVNQWLTA